MTDWFDPRVWDAVSSSNTVRAGAALILIGILQATNFNPIYIQGLETILAGLGIIGIRIALSATSSS